MTTATPQIRYRTLRSAAHGADSAPSGAAPAFIARPHTATPAGRLAPREVVTGEGHASLNDVARMVELGELSLTDLINLGRGWQMVEQCPELAEIVEPLLRRRERRARIASAFWLGLGIFGAAMVFYGMFLGSS